MSEPIDRERYRDLLAESVNATLGRGSFVASWLGLLCGAALLVAHLGGGQPVLVPAIWALACGAYAFTIHLLARAGRVRGAGVWAAILGYVSLPTVIYVVAHLLLPSGAATYITGPPSYLYLLMVLLAGFSLDERLAVFAGLLAGVEYTVVFFLDHHHLTLRADDPLLLADVTGPGFYLFKAMMMLFAGLVVRILIRRVHRLIAGVLREEDEKRSLSRLFGVFVSQEVRDKIVREKASLVGEKREVAVLFSDLRGFTSYSEQKDPADVVARLNEYFDRMVDCVSREGGVVDKFIGDAVMAVFGGVIPLADPCGAALRAARAMRRALGELNREWSAAGLPAFDSGVGIDFGTVLQGTIGSRDRKDFTVIGDTVNTASRVEGLCKNQPEKILVTAEVAAELDEATRAELVDHGEVVVKGKSEPVRVYGARD